jgi:hypothetical protein
MPATLFVEGQPMIIWDEKDPWGPRRGDKCALCRGPLRVPLVVWHAHENGDPDEYDGYARFFCGECCADICSGFSYDLRQITTAKKVERLGFRRAGKQAAVSGGFLYTTGTSNKQ